MKKFNLFCILGVVITTGNAANLDKCFSLASKQYNVPTKLLRTIAKTETKFDEYAINVNKNRTYDIGIMQINSTWLKKLGRVGITQVDLIDGCKNIQ